MQLLDKALKVCGNNQSLLARKLNTSRQLLWVWRQKKQIPHWRISAIKLIADGK